jgi:hypothetical protein
MYWESVLSSAIEVGIGIAGFSGIVAVISRRSREGSAVERIRLNSLLGSSFAAIFFAFLPFILLSTGIPIVLTWRISSAFLCLILTVVLAIRFRQFRTASPQMSRQESITFVCVGALAVLQFVNVVAIEADWPFLVGILGSLGVAAAQFIRLLVKLES